jgi:flagellar basal body-associated protein FliL
MTQANDATTSAGVGQRGGRAFRSWRLIVVLVVFIAVAAAGAAGYWYYFIAQRVDASTVQVHEAEAPLPFYLELKPFVVSMVNNTGVPHFVQLGLNLTLPGAEASNVVSGVLPELQDRMRQTILTFKVEDIVTPSGIDKMREALITNVNQVMLQRLGADRVKRLGGGDGNRGLVHDIYFTTLIVE